MTELSNSQFDLRAAAEAGAWMTVRDPHSQEELGERDDKGKIVKPTRIKIKGMDSLSYEESVARSAFLAQQQTVPPKNQLTERHLFDSMQRTKKSRAEELASITITWEGFTLEGEPYEFSYENAVHVYTKWSWIADQLSKFFIERSNYLGNA